MDSHVRGNDAPGVVRRIPRGFTLLEVLIALLVFSLGLLGMAGLLVVSVRTNHSAYLRTQASFLAQSMADRMRGNLARVWAGDYAKTYPTTDTDPCASGVACSRADIAVRDRALWSAQLTDLLPNSSATVACARNAPAALIDAAAQAKGALYDGLCTLSLAWSESSLDRGATAKPQTQTFTWVLQP